jgi:hypothetical protein
MLTGSWRVLLAFLSRPIYRWLGVLSHCINLWFIFQSFSFFRKVFVNPWRSNSHSGHSVSSRGWTSGSMRHTQSRSESARADPSSQQTNRRATSSTSPPGSKTLMSAVDSDHGGHSQPARWFRFQHQTERKGLPERKKRIADFLDRTCQWVGRIPDNLGPILEAFGLNHIETNFLVQNFVSSFFVANFNIYQCREIDVISSASFGDVWEITIAFSLDQ